MSRRASELADRIRSRLPDPQDEGDELLIRTQPSIAVADGVDSALAAQREDSIRTITGGDRAASASEDKTPERGPRTAGVADSAPWLESLPPGKGDAESLRGNVATSQGRNRADLVTLLAQGQRGWETPSIWRARHDVRSIGYDVPGRLALEFARAKLDLEREVGRRLTNEDLVHPALHALPEEPAQVAAELRRMQVRLGSGGPRQRLTAYVALDLKHKLEDLAFALHSREDMRVQQRMLWALAVARLLETLGEDDGDGSSSPLAPA